MVRHQAAGDDGRDLCRRRADGGDGGQNPAAMPGQGLIFGAVIGAAWFHPDRAAGVAALFPPVVTGTIIAVIGISLMRVGINWIFGNPVGPTAPSCPTPEHANGWPVARPRPAGAPGSSRAPVPKGFAIGPHSQPQVRRPDGRGISAIVLLSILLIASRALPRASGPISRCCWALLRRRHHCRGGPDELSTRWARRSGSTSCCRSRSPCRSSTPS